MAKLNKLFPKTISFGAVGGPAWNTDVVVLGSGFENRNQNWAQARCMWDVSKACRNRNQVNELIAFFRVTKGRLHSFRFWDFTDYEVLSGQGILVSLGGGIYQLYKEYSNSVGTDVHKIVFPVASTIVIKAGIDTLDVGVDYTLDDTTGRITLIGSPGGPTSWTGQFHRHARFDDDKLQLQVEGNANFFRANQIMIVEVRD